MKIFTQNNKNGSINKIFAALFWLAVWQAASMLVGSSLLLPSPAVTFKALLMLLVKGEFYKSVLFTLLRVTGGFAAGVILGTLAGILTAFFGFADMLLTPLRGFIKATPVASMIVLILLWLTKSITPVWISFLMVLPVMWGVTHEGIRSADAKLVEMSRVFALSKTDAAKYVYMPLILPQYKTSLGTALGFAFKSGIAAEVIATPAFSVGKSIYESKLYLETPELFAWTAVVVILSIVTEKLMLLIIRMIKI